MKLRNLKTLLGTIALGLFAIVGTAEIANAQTYRDYKRYEKRQRQIEKQQRKLQRQQQRAYYRLYNNGRYYQVDNRGVEILRQAVNSGYQQGYYAGQRDRAYGRGYNYYNQNLYRSGTYGYNRYVDSSQYRYYFQQGFSRGYEDGYRSSSRYGYRSNNGLNILGTILQGILNISQ